MHFASHYSSLILTPLIRATDGECSDPNCTGRHFVIEIGWVFWTLIIVL